MKGIINRAYQFFYRYRKLVKLIDRYVTFKDVVKSVFSSILIALLIVLPFILVAINMFIYAKHTVLIAILLVILVMIWSMFYYMFYYRFLKYYEPKINDINTKIPQWTETFLASFLFMMIGILIIVTIL
jgi:hypothetical protein